MARLLKPAGSNGTQARMLAADFGGFVRDGATFKLRGSVDILRDGDMILFEGRGGVESGINVSEDDDGLHSLIAFGPSVTLRIGLEKRDGGEYAFRPALHHLEMWPQLAATGGGERIG